MPVLREGVLGPASIQPTHALGGGPAHHRLCRRFPAAPLTSRDTVATHLPPSPVAVDQAKLGTPTRYGHRRYGNHQHPPS